MINQLFASGTDKFSAAGILTIESMVSFLSLMFVGAKSRTVCWLICALCLIFAVFTDVVSNKPPAVKAQNAFRNQSFVVTTPAYSS